MAVPATVFLLPFIIFLQKPVPGEWSKVFGKSTATDWEIFTGLIGLCGEHPGAKKNLALAILSGAFSFIYNIIQFTIVHTLSPSATAFGGNFNKAALVFLTLLLPFLQVHALPAWPYNLVIWMAVIGNVAAFSFYSYLQLLAKQKAAKEKEKEAKKQNMLANEDEEDDDEDEE